jgi:hypothetical protein
MSNNIFNCSNGGLWGAKFFVDIPYNTIIALICTQLTVVVCNIDTLCFTNLMYIVKTSIWKYNKYKIL